MGQPDKYNLQRYVKNGSTKATVFLALKIATKFSIHCGAQISSEISFGVATTVKLGFKFDFKIFFKLKINSKCGISIFIADVESIFEVLFKN